MCSGNLSPSPRNAPGFLRMSQTEHVVQIRVALANGELAPDDALCDLVATNATHENEHDEGNAGDCAQSLLHTAYYGLNGDRCNHYSRTF